MATPLTDAPIEPGSHISSASYSSATTITTTSTTMVVTTATSDLSIAERLVALEPAMGLTSTPSSTPTPSSESPWFHSTRQSNQPTSGQQAGLDITVLEQQVQYYLQSALSSP